MQDKKNACIVGYGAIGPIHAKAIADSDYAKLYAVCDCIPERADKGAGLYNARAMYDFEEMLTDENIDVVHICTPHYLHKDMAIKALTSGKNIVLEKPVSMTISEFSQLKEFYKTCDKKACAMFQNRTNASIRMMKDLIDNDKTLGKMLGISGFVTWSRNEAYYNSEDWRGKWTTEGGGVLINQTIHTLDLIDWLGGGIKSVKSSMSNKNLSMIEVEDTVDALFVMNNGCHGVFFATNNFGVDSSVKIEITFENAILRYADSRLYKITDDVEILANDTQAEAGKAYWGNGHRYVINQFYNALINNSDDYMDLTTAFHSAKAMFAIYRTEVSRNEKWIEI